VNGVNVSLNGRRIKAVECYRYLGADITNDGRMNEEMRHRIGEARKASGALRYMTE